MSSDIGVSNAGYTHVKDTFHGSSVLSGLLDTGIFPGSFKIVKGYVDFSDASNQSVGNGKPIISYFDGVQVLLATNDILLQVVAIGGDITSDGTPTFDIGFAPTPGAAVDVAVFTAESLANVNSGVSEVTPSKIAASQWAAVDVNADAVTGGKLDVVLFIA